MENIISHTKVRSDSFEFGFEHEFDIFFNIVLDRCKEFDSVSGYNYRSYFELSELKHATLKDDELININLIILGAKDAHILLTPTIDPGINSPVYEIGIRFFFLV